MTKLEMVQEIYDWWGTDPWWRNFIDREYGGVEGFARKMRKCEIEDMYNEYLQEQ